MSQFAAGQAIICIRQAKKVQSILAGAPTPGRAYVVDSARKRTDSQGYENYPPVVTLRGDASWPNGWSEELFRAATEDEIWKIVGQGQTDGFPITPDAPDEDGFTVTAPEMSVGYTLADRLEQLCKEAGIVIVCEEGTFKARPNREREKPALARFLHDPARGYPTAGPVSRGLRVVMIWPLLSRSMPGNQAYTVADSRRRQRENKKGRDFIDEIMLKEHPGKWFPFAAFRAAKSFEITFTDETLRGRAKRDLDKSLHGWREGPDLFRSGLESASLVENLSYADSRELLKAWGDIMLTPPSWTDPSWDFYAERYRKAGDQLRHGGVRIPVLPPGIKINRNTPFLDPNWLIGPARLTMADMSKAASWLAGLTARADNPAGVVYADEIQESLWDAMSDLARAGVQWLSYKDDRTRGITDQGLPPPSVWADLIDYRAKPLGRVKMRFMSVRDSMIDDPDVACVRVDWGSDDLNVERETLFGGKTRVRFAGDLWPEPETAEIPEVKIKSFRGLTLTEDMRKAMAGFLPAGAVLLGVVNRAVIYELDGIKYEATLHLGQEARV